LSTDRGGVSVTHRVGGLVPAFCGHPWRLLGARRRRRGGPAASAPRWVGQPPGQHRRRSSPQRPGGRIGGRPTDDVGDADRGLPRLGHRPVIAAVARWGSGTAGRGGRQCGLGPGNKPRRSSLAGAGAPGAGWPPSSLTSGRSHRHDVSPHSGTPEPHRGVGVVGVVGVFGTPSSSSPHRRLTGFPFPFLSTSIFISISSRSSRASGSHVIDA
jgi:hypothetical protein